MAKREYLVSWYWGHDFGGVFSFKSRADAKRLSALLKRTQPRHCRVEIT